MNNNANRRAESKVSSLNTISNMAPTKKAPLTRNEMLALIAKERQILEDEMGTLEPRQLTQAGVTDANWSVKDLMAHLMEWEQMFLGWYRAGLKGEIPDTPAPGYTWGWESLHKLNEKIYRRYRRKPWAEVQSLFATSYAEVIGEIKRISDDDLNQTGRFVWTGKGTLGGFYYRQYMAALSLGAHAYCEMATRAKESCCEAVKTVCAICRWIA